MKIMSSLTMRSSTMSDKWHRRPNSSTSSNYSVRRSPRTQQINSSPVLRPERYFFSHDTQAWSEKKRVEALTREVVRRHPWANQMRSTKLKNVRIARGPSRLPRARLDPMLAGLTDFGRLFFLAACEDWSTSPPATITSPANSALIRA